MYHLGGMYDASVFSLFGVDEKEKGISISKQNASVLAPSNFPTYELQTISFQNVIMWMISWKNKDSEHQFFDTLRGYLLLILYLQTAITSQYSVNY